MNRRKAPWLLVVPLSVGLLRGARWPSGWPVTHYLFSYSRGATHRALVGEVLARVLGSALSYRSIVAVQMFVFGASVALVGRLYRRDAAAPSPRADLVALASPFVLFWAHTVGYLDQVALLVALTPFSSLSKRLHERGQRALVVAAMIVALLVHEASLVFLLPLFLLAWLQSFEGRGRFAVTLARAASLLGVAAALLLAFAKLPRSSFRAPTIDIAVRADAVVVLNRTLRESHQEMLRRLGGGHWRAALEAALQALPWLVAIVALRPRALRDTVRGPALLLAFATPPAMTLIGWDFSRWWALGLGVSWLCTWLGGAVDEAAKAARRPPMALVAVALTVGALQPYPTFVPPRALPITDALRAHVEAARRCIADHARCVSVPR